LMKSLATVDTTNSSQGNRLNALITPSTFLMVGRGRG
jgi:hypothetical protein